MSTISGISHVSLSVRDRRASARWYADVFGFESFEELEQPEYTETVMVHPAGIILCLQQHRTNEGETFRPQRTGLDHLALRVADRATLDEWSRVLEGKGVRHSPVVDMPYGSVLCLRDPDDIQLELFYRENHP
jgi:glyoxylase I family protein